VTGALLRWAGAGVDISQYYPKKSLWFAAVFLAPLSALMLAKASEMITRPAWRRTGELRYAFVLRSSVIAVLCAVVLAGWLPWRIGAGIASVNTLQPASDGSFAQPNRSAQRFDIAIHYGREHAPLAIVPFYVGSSSILDPYGTRMVSSLLAFQTGQKQIRRDPDSVCTAISVVAGQREAVVISKLPRERVLANMARFGCVGRAEVLMVPGGINDPVPEQI
jgi:hypothetical protein